MLTRRGVMGGVMSGLVVLPAAGCSGAAKISRAGDFAAGMIDIQRRHGGRIGVCAIDHATGARLSVSSDQRFAMCSVFKWLLATAVLAGVDAGRLNLAQTVAYGRGDLLDWAPVTGQHVGEGKLSLAMLCAAAVSQSDNTAANLLLPLIGGPAGLTAYVRSLGDTVTRFDRTEPDLNSNIDGDPRDTTTPEAMAQLLQTVFTGTALKPESLDQLKTWMVATTTGKKRIAAAVPAGWTVGDKTGTANTACNDVAVIWPAQAAGKTRGPISLAVLTSGGGLDADGRNAVIADTARLVLEAMA